MADITDHNEGSPSALDDHVGNGLENRGVKRQRPTAADDDDDDDDKPGRERRKIEIKFITDKSRRHITFSKRKAGIMKKVGCINWTRRRTVARDIKGRTSLTSKQAYELSVLTGTQVLLLVVSETGLVYTFTTPKLQPLVTKAEGKNLIQVCARVNWCIRHSLINISQACLNAPEPAGNGENGVDDQAGVDSPEEPSPQHLPQQGRAMPQQNPNMHPGYMAPSLEQQQALAYQNYVAQQQRGGGGYPMPPQAGIPQQHSHQA
jgi:pheromone receptor transcription factor